MTRGAKRENPLVVQWLGLSALTAEGPGLISGQQTEIPQVVWFSKKKREKQEHSPKQEAIFVCRDRILQRARGCQLHIKTY